MTRGAVVTVLAIPERLSVCAIILMILILIVISQFRGPKQIPEEGDAVALFSNKIEIQITGAVEFPGSYFVEKGSELSNLLSQAHPLPTADLRRFKQETLIKRKRSIHIAPLPYLIIHLEGAVKQPGEYKILKGTRLNELSNLIVFEEEADLSLLQKERKVRSGEVLKIPFNPGLSKR